MTPAHDVLTAEYEEHKAEVIRTVRSKISAAGIRSPDGELEASYNEAWHALYLSLAGGETIENRVGYLVTVTHRRALNELRALKVSRRADPESLDNIGVELDLDARLDAEIQLQQIREGFRSKLSPRERDAATLCHLYGYTRPEAAKALGLRPKRLEKIMDKASGKIRSVVETVRAGEHCQAMSSSVRAFSLGILDPEGEKYQSASEHLQHCAACRREVRVDRGLAALGPPLPAAFALLAGSATTGGGAAGAALAGAGEKSAATTSGAGGGSGGTAGTGGSGGAGGGSFGSGLVLAAVAAAAVAVAVTAGLFTGLIGGDDPDPSPGHDSVTVSQAGQDAASTDAAAKAARAAAAKKADRRRARARKRRAAAKRRQARREAEVQAAVATPALSPENTYVPPPPPTPPPPQPVAPAPVNPPPVTRPSAPSKPTTDAGEEFGLR